MKHTDFYNMICQESGVITTDETGVSTCTACGGIGPHFEASVKHKKNCPFIKAVEGLQKVMPDKSIPTVENQITLGMLLPYITEMSAKEIQQATSLVDCMKDADTMEDRADVAVLIREWCSYVKPDILDAVIIHGLPDENAVITFRNYIIYERGNLNESLRLGAELIALEKNIQVMTPRFRALFTRKYPNYKQSDAEPST